MHTPQSRKILNDFHRHSTQYGATYIHPHIIHKLKTLNASIKPKIHTFRATVPGYYVEWYYDANTALYYYISGVVNGTVFIDRGDLEALCDTFERMFGYDV